MSFLFARLKFVRGGPVGGKQSDGDSAAKGGDFLGKLLPEFGHRDRERVFAFQNDGRRGAQPFADLFILASRLISTELTRNPSLPIDMVDTFPIVSAAGILINLKLVEMPLPKGRGFKLSPNPMRTGAPGDQFEGFEIN